MANKSEPAIFILDDDPDICTLLQRYLTKRGFQVETALSVPHAFKKLKLQEYDIVFCDYRLKEASGLEVLKEVKKRYPLTEVIIITAYSDIKTAVNLIKSGAFDYLCKPLIPDELNQIIPKALERRRQKTEGQALRAPSGSGSNSANRKETFFSGHSPAILEVYRQIEIVAPTQYSIILHGESGSGKEVMAKTIHQKSKRKNCPFIAVDCGTLSKELANSELFGHIKGSFTGAISDKKGSFETAHGGTLFLDEVANLSGDIQASLLRVIQERKLKRIGSNKETELDIRIIVASHENLRTACEKGLFREDLFHRLNEFSITIPPLRKRKEDIPDFASYFLELTNQETGKQVMGFEDEVMDQFLNYSWPGNARELKNVIRKAVLLTASNHISIDALSSELLQASITSTHPDKNPPKDQDFDTAHPDLKEASREVEYQTIMAVLKSVQFNKSKAAKILNIDRKTLYNKVKEYENEK